MRKVLAQSARRGLSRHHRRGTVYVLVLGVTALLVVLGVAGALLARSVADRGRLQEEQARARVLSESYLDIVHARLNGGTAWRNLNSNNTWSNPSESLAGGVVQYKLADEMDGSLSDDLNEPVRLYARASVGEAVRVYSVELRPSNGGSTLRRISSTLRQDADK